MVGLFKISAPDIQRYLLVLDKLKAAVMATRKQIPFMMAVGLQYDLLDRIANQRFPGVPYAVYHPDYAAWKSSSGNFWRLDGDLVNAITKVPVNKNDWKVGVKDKKDSGGKSWFGQGDRGKPKSIGMYATVMEEGMPVSIRGSGVHPARPLFRPAALEYFVNEGPAVVDKEKRRIVGSWKY
jgi:hypothetical protein